VTSACEDQNGNLVVGTLGAGVFWSDGAGKWTNLSTNDGLSSNQILSMQMDREGTLWVGTDGNGLNRVRRHIFEVLESSRGQVVQSVSEDRNGGLYIGYNNTGVDYWSNGVLNKVNTGPDMMNMSVKAVFVDRAQRVWAGTSAFLRAGLFQLYGGQFQRVASSLVANRDVSALHEDGQGRLWVGTRGGLVVWDGNGWNSYSTRDGLSADDVSAIAHDKEDGLWIGTRGGGLNRLHQGRFTVFRRTAGGLPGTISRRCSSMRTVCFGSARMAGAWRVSRPGNGRVTRRQKASSAIASPTSWKTSRGFSGSARARDSCASRKSPSTIWRRMPAPFYLCAPMVNRTACLSANALAARSRPRVGPAAASFFFPTIHGLAIVDPTQLRTNSTPPPVTIEAVLVGGVVQGAVGLRTPRPEAATVPASEESLEIHYTSLNLSAPLEPAFAIDSKDTKKAGSKRVMPASRITRSCRPANTAFSSPLATKMASGMKQEPSWP
jgi:hypothetical protein